MNICAKAHRLLGFLKCNLRRCPTELRAKAYTTLVRPGIEYASSIWDPHQTTLIQKLENVQRSGARFVTNTPHRRTAGPHESVTDMITQLGWPTLASRRRDARLVLMYKMTNNLVAIPVTYHPVLVIGSTGSAAAQHLTIIPCRLDVYKYSTIPRTDWNLLPLEVRTATSLDQFKGGLRRM